MTNSTNPNPASPDRLEGFWRSHEGAEQDLPFPVAGEPWEGQAAFLSALAEAEAKAQSLAYRGWSPCRLCGRANGNVTYELDGWHWPSGYAHYIRDHNVRPTDDFERFINPASPATGGVPEQPLLSEPQGIAGAGPAPGSAARESSGTLSADDAGLVERLRAPSDQQGQWPGHTRLIHPDGPEAANRIEALSKEASDLGQNAADWTRRFDELALKHEALSSATVPADDVVELRKRIFRAISDPGETEGFKGDDRTLTEWQTDAVIRALSCTPPLIPGEQK